ncbi:MAG TPA: polymer-forming cytoskeletal protein [Candidatus Latescibacteria bacterium]|nr:polymer-forming cytoskeletal protein [Candidatus Handelsmanbacteria bacterium]HIL07504.1 polymer-forming cytoskeletal protein [Candidatus Latescibacterota bacterium]
MAKKAREKDAHNNTLIGAGTVLDGTLDIEYDVRVDGTLRGERLATRQALTVGSEGEVLAASIEVAEAFIAGQVNGSLKASEQVYLKAGACFKGVLRTPKLVIEEGASLVEAEVVGQQEQQEAE